MESDPFADLKIDSQAFLDEMDGRMSCPKCGKSRKYYCYTCYVPVLGIEDKIPKVKLPFKIDIIKHPSECDGKSTSGHARVIAPDDVTIYTYPCIPDYPDQERVVLLFPGAESINMAALAEKYSRCVHNNKQEDKKDQHNNISEEKTDVVYASLEKVSSDVGQTCTGAHKDISSSPEGKLVSEDDAKQTSEGCDRMTHGNTEITQKTGVKRKHLSDEEEVKRSKLTMEDTKRLEVKPPFDRVIIIDSTWNQTKRISSDERLKGLACIELKTRHSNFWRHQKDIPSTYLSTIEAIYYFLRDYHDVFVARDEYDGRYDNLLFFFTFMYSKIRNMYNGGKNLKAYTQRKDNGKSESKE
ncbi:DTW domain-containing protein 1-like isoform X1 [Pecten maximus]|uniref:DTW domain-containing protein 1-like isoform X1 n=1 Tax=Pecten maximus TaxID=6579 RepID=UPI00145916DB|nr:DTW domain-containing protein 1-like isoform X1 [Pecten maximus]XP_033732982.1 DTW domain-containing protein 1-like isoform X1 [Pecten maximus]